MQLTLTTKAFICQQLYLMWQTGLFQPIEFCLIYDNILWPYPEWPRPNSVKRRDSCWSQDQTYVPAPGQERKLRNGATCPTRNHRLRIAFYMLDNWCPPEMVLACHLGLQIWHIAPTTNTSIQHEKCGDHTAIHDNSRLREWSGWSENEEEEEVEPFLRPWGRNRRRGIYRSATLMCELRPRGCEPFCS